MVEASSRELISNFQLIKMELVLILLTIGFVTGVTVGVVLSAVVESFTDVPDIKENKQKSL